jgi:hypothetical protein
MSSSAQSRPTLGILAFLIVVCPALFAQDEIRLSDGGVLQGKIINETPTSIELRHPDFGVIQIPKSKILQMGPYGTLPPMPKASERKPKRPRRPGAPRAESGQPPRSGGTSAADADAGDPLAAAGPLTPSISPGWKRNGRRSRPGGDLRQDGPQRDP